MDSGKEFTANLYVKGLPVVLNQQRLKLRLRDPRITKREQLDVEVAMADSAGSSFITLAGHEDDKPLLLKFVPKGDQYLVSVNVRGAYNGWHLGVDANTHHVLVSDKTRPDEFSINKYDSPKAGLEDLSAGPSYVQVVSELNGRALYLEEQGGKIIFKNVDPNTTGHNAFNNEPVTFVLKIIDKPVGVD